MQKILDYGQTSGIVYGIFQSWKFVVVFSVRIDIWVIIFFIFFHFLSNGKGPLKFQISGYSLTFSAKIFYSWLDQQLYFKSVIYFPHCTQSIRLISLWLMISTPFTNTKLTVISAWISFCMSIQIRPIQVNF